MRNYKKSINKVYLLFGIILILNLCFISATEHLYYTLKLNYSYGEVKIKDLKVELDLEYRYNIVNTDIFSNYYYSVVDKDNKVLEEDIFSIPNKARYDIYDNTTDEMIGGGFIELNSSEIDIYVPYYENSKEIVIYSFDRKMLDRILVSQYSKIGFNKGDFINGSNADNNIIGNIQTGENSDKNTNKDYDILNRNLILIILLVSIVVIILIIFIMLYNKKKK